MSALPFELTGAQRRAVGEIDADLGRAVPMRRLLQGDVGSGKTAVAAYALVRGVEAGGQGALMAPTETLATQHLIGLAALCEPLGVRVIGLMQGMAARERRAAEGLLRSGEPAVAVGTHALIQAGVDYGELRVAVVDEQHRFGVEQRQALEEKAREGPSPHVLHMTATPIPRTLALSVYGDLEVSVLDELPAGRAPVVTRVLGLERRDEVFARMRRLLDEGRQAYVVCPLVTEGDDARAAAAAESEAARLGSGELEGYRLECIHGQLPVPERRRIMNGFRAGEVQVLVATTVIEVGVDVPNATVMVIEQADLFGLAQLHQLRGRVGRGAHESYCMLLARSRHRRRPRPPRCDGADLGRLRARRRRPRAAWRGRAARAAPERGADLRHARLARQRRLASEARTDAKAVLAADPEMTGPAAAIVAEATRRAFGADVDWMAPQ